MWMYPWRLYYTPPTDTTSPNFMFEYGGDRNNISEDTEVLEMHAVEKQLMSIDTVATTPTRCVADSQADDDIWVNYYLPQNFVITF